MSDIRSLAKIDAVFATSCLATSSDLLLELMELWESQECAYEIFSHLRTYIAILPQDKMHTDLKQKIQSLNAQLDLIKPNKNPLRKEKEKPKILKLHEPEFETEYVVHNQIDCECFK